jgi:hypothetical protein
MNLLDLLKNLSKTYNSLVDKAKVPEEAWQPDKEFFVRDGTGVISGALDQGIEEIKDIPEIVGLGLGVVSDPQGAYDQLSAFAQEMDWQKAKTMAKEVVRGAVFADEFEKGGIYALHGTGRAGVVVAKAGLTGGGVLLLVRKTGADLLALLSKIRKRLEDLNWSQADMDRFAYDLGTAKDLLERFDLDPDNFDLNASKVLDQFKNLRRRVDNQAFLTQIQKNLPDGVTMDDIKGAITASDSKQDLIDRLKGFVDENDMEGLKACIDGKIKYVPVADLVTSSITRPSNAAIEALAQERQTARKAAADLRSQGSTYQDELKANMQTVIAKSEALAESIADAHFIKNGSVKIDLSLPGAGKSGQFDRVYKNSDGTWSIVECKGGASPLKGRSGAQQGTKPYIDSIIANLESKRDLLTLEQNSFLTQLRSAYKSGQIKSYVLRQKFNDDGGLGNTLLSTVTN